MADPRPWRVHAPDAFAAFDRAEALAAAAFPVALLAPVHQTVAAHLANPSDSGRVPVVAPGTPADPRTDVGVRFAEQFVVDVAGTTTDQRAALSGAFGSDTFLFTQVCYVVDVFQRGRMALGRLYGSPFGAPEPPEPGAATDLWPVLEEFMQVVARRAALDPLTTELVRLRGARVHQCRLCQSRLSVRALDQAGSARPFDAIDRYESSDLGDAHKVALRLTDAIVTQPASIDAALVEQVFVHYDPDQITEIVLDVVRNAANKISVALGADAANVTGGTEYFDLDGAGAVVADVDASVVRARR